jgi:hypothetical protein
VQLAAVSGVDGQHSIMMAGGQCIVFPEGLSRSTWLWALVEVGWWRSDQINIGVVSYLTVASIFSLYNAAS